MSLYFSDDQDTVDCGSDISIDNVWDGGGTAMCWFNVASFGGAGGGRIFQRGWLFYFSDTNDTVRLLIIWSGGNARWELPINFMNDKFDQDHHVMVTYNADSTANDPIFYFDGASVAVTEVDSPTGTRTSDVGSDLGIGNRPGAGARQTDGNLADARLYNRILSAEEAAVIYAAKGHDGIVNSLVGRWLMNEGAPGTTATVAGSVIDSSQYGNHGTPEDAPVYDSGIIIPRRRINV